MDKIVNLSKRRGFVFQSAEIYGGSRSTYDYGPIGVLLLRNVKDQWWRTMVQLRHDVVGIDAAIIGPPPVFEALPEPQVPDLDEPYGILVTGIGGTGVVTIGALIGMAAHLEGKGTSILDMTGLAQKGGAVISHVKIAATPDDLHAPRVASGAADLMLACDIATATSKDGLKAMSRERTRAGGSTIGRRRPQNGRLTGRGEPEGDPVAVQ